MLTEFQFPSSSEGLNRLPFSRTEGSWKDLGFGGLAGGGKGTPQKICFERNHGGGFAFKNLRPGWLAQPSWDAFFGFSVGRERGIKKRKYHFLNY